MSEREKSGDDASMNVDAVRAKQAKEGQTYGAIVRSQLRKNRVGMIGLRVIGFIVFLALFAPLLANDRPIVARYKGETCFPAFTTYVDVWVPWRGIRYEMKSLRIGGSYPFSDHYAALEGRTWKEALENDKDNVSFSLSPPIPWHPNQISKTELKQSPSWETRHYMGTDDQGRDVCSRIVHGCVVAVTVGVVSTGIAALIGILLGVSAGYFGGWVDMVLSRVVEIVMCFPTFFLIIAVISFLPPSIMNIMLVLGAFGWTGIYRLIRGEVLKCRSLDYVTAARALGIPARGTMFRHILPNAISPVFVSVAFGIAGAVLTETSLSFLGFGDPSVPSWGEIVSQGRQYVVEGKTHLVMFPGLAIFLTLTAFNLFGQGLRDAMDPRLRR